MYNKLFFKNNHTIWFSRNRKHPIDNIFKAEKNPVKISISCKSGFS